MTFERSREAAIVVGASGGIGVALADALMSAGYGTVHRLARSGPIACDLADPASIAAAVATALNGPPVTSAIIATGLLHDATNGPEKSLRELDADWLARQFAVNVTGPALILSYLLPKLPRDRPVRVAALGARVGSISHNRLGGWYGYRASKAALHQIIRTASIEWARSHKAGVLVALHPGTVATPLSAPFSRSTEGKQLLTPPESATALLAVLDNLTPAQSGHIFDWQGQEIAP
jgi:NAD(P)-dependent dehydrogenase (short-subunit alcohol dehydrogenase family)